MGSSRAAVAFAIVLALGSPAAVAAWGVKGHLEPSTSRDRDDGYMWSDPDQAAGGARKVYFNGFMGAYAVYATHFSPNAAAAGTAIQPYPAEAWGVLGVWKDCNKDGYIGFGDQGLWEYRVELLALPGGPGASVCPNEGPIDPRFPFVAEGWMPPHNDGQWVHEFIAIGWRDWRDSVDLNPWAINDSAARVWADYGLPESRQGLLCSVDPAPRGTYQSTGGFLAYSDCFTGYKGTEAVNAAAAATGLSQISFADKPHGQQGSSKSLLNQKNPWGREGDASYVGAWDCSRPPAVSPRDPTWNGQSGPTHVPVANPAPAGDRTLWVNFSDREGRLGFSMTGVYGGTFLNVNVSQPRAVPTVDPAGSPAGTINDTQSSYGNCVRDDNTGPGSSHAAYALEGDVVVRGAQRVSSDFSLHYEMGRSRAGPHTLTGRGAPPDYGVKLTGREFCYNTGVLYQIWCYDGLWHDVALNDATRVASTPNPYADRNTLTAEPVSFITYYASVGAAATSAYNLRFPGTTGSYGSEGCGLSPPTFECDAAKWWPGNTAPRTAWLGPDPDGLGNRQYGVRVGQAYQLRDVDCDDQSVAALRENGLTWGTVTGTRCL